MTHSSKNTEWWEHELPVPGHPDDALILRLVHGTPLSEAEAEAVRSFSRPRWISLYRRWVQIARHQWQVIDKHPEIEDRQFKAAVILESVPSVFRRLGVDAPRTPHPTHINEDRYR